MTTNLPPRSETTGSLLSLSLAMALLGPAMVAQAQAAPPVTASAKPIPAAKGALVVLLRQGAAPLIALRLGLSKTAVEKGEFSFKTTVEVELPTGPQKIDPPRMSIGLAATHAPSVAPDAVAIGAKFGPLRIEGPNADALKAQVRSAETAFEGITSDYVVTNRGLVTSSSVKIGPDVAPTFRQMAEQMKSSLDQAMLPFPDEPVGIGAQWRQESSNTSLGAPIDMVSTYELVERTKTFVRVKRTTVAKAAPGGVMNVPGSDAKVELVSLDGVGEGEIRQSFDQVLPSSWKLEVRMRMSLKTQGQLVNQATTILTTGGLKLAKK